MTRELLRQIIDELDDVLVPIAAKALTALLKGEDPKATLTRAERDAIAEYSQKRFDQALERGKGKPVPGTGE